MGPEQERLAKRLFEDPSRKTLNFGITPGAKPATAEELCAEVNKALDEMERFNALPIEEHMRIQMTEVYERLSRATDLRKFSIKDWGKPAESHTSSLLPGAAGPAPQITA